MQNLHRDCGRLLNILFNPRAISFYMQDSVQKRPFNSAIFILMAPRILSLSTMVINRYYQVIGKLTVIWYGFLKNRKLGSSQACPCLQGGIQEVASSILVSSTTEITPFPPDKFITLSFLPFSLSHKN